AGRVHNAIDISPVLNLNKLIKPEFAIFRVVTTNKSNFHRDIAVAFFNGYGTEINCFNPGKPDWLRDELLYLGKTTRILRDNSSVFLNDKWTPLIPTMNDHIWVNRWEAGSKVLYTVLSLDPNGVHSPLFEVYPKEGFHFVSLWNHEELIPELKEGKYFIPVHVEAYNAYFQETNAAGNVDCVVSFPEILKIERRGATLRIVASEGDRLRVWNRNVSVSGKFVEFKTDTVNISLSDIFYREEGKFIVRLFEGKELLDERIIYIESGLPFSESEVIKTKEYKKAPVGMMEIPEGDFLFQVSNPDQFIPYPDFSKGEMVHIAKFYMDEYPVTNKDFYTFLEMSKYKPLHSKNFLKHWENGTYPTGQDNYPVVNISLEDAKAYAAWAGKRLPSEKEWQYAAQGTDKRMWPWGNTFHGTRCNNGFNQLTPVDAFPKGASPFNIIDLVGNVWQFTNDVYDVGNYKYVIIRGGSYFNPTSSNWYVKGGPQPLNRTQMLLLLSPGFDRNATLGFRCVTDAE
ncbi:MAG: formylglycine-generating enzyme family protein, partial [Bacteroidales bacterium]|nr:formylglycine-generating enzyme family protein [Bacteroidales bacterium]